MPVTFTDNLGAALEGAAALLASSPAFRTWAGVADEAAALERIRFSTVESDNWVRPGVVIVMGEGMAHRMTGRDGGGDDYAPSPGGSIGLQFESAAAAEHVTGLTLNDVEASNKAFMKSVLDVMQEVTTLAGGAGALIVERIRPEHAAPELMDVEQGVVTGPYWWWQWAWDLPNYG